MPMTRREFLARGSAAFAAARGVSGTAFASPMNEPLGFQAFEIIPDLNRDWDGTWKTMAGIGYRFIDLVTSAPYLSASRSARDLRATIDAHGLGCTNAHFSYNAFKTSFADTMATAHDLKVASVVCAPWNRRRTSDDWKAMAAELNAFGAATKAEGILLGYHNHEIEFRPTADGGMPYDILMANTDAALVKFQIDVGNLTFAGADAVSYLERYPTRYFSLHAKDFLKGKASVPVGQGSMDWRRIFDAAKRANITNYVAEVGAYGASTLSGPLEPSAVNVIESFRQSYRFLEDFQN